MKDEEEVLSRVGSQLTSMLQVPELSTSLGLRSVCLHGNGIQQIASLQHLPALAELNLSSNSILSLQGLGTLSALTSLNLASNRLTEVGGLGGLPRLVKLSLSHNFISNLTGLSELHGDRCSLAQLDLRNNQIAAVQDLTVLAGCVKLRDLSIAGGSPGNPCCEWPGLRLAVAVAFPAIQLLDGLSLQTDRSSAAAKELSLDLPQSLAALQLQALAGTAALPAAGPLQQTHAQALGRHKNAVHRHRTALSTPQHSTLLDLQPDSQGPHSGPHLQHLLHSHPALPQQLQSLLSALLPRTPDPHTSRQHAEAAVQTQAPAAKVKHRGTSARVYTTNRGTQTALKERSRSSAGAEVAVQTLADGRETDALQQRVEALQQQLEAAQKQAAAAEELHAERLHAAVQAKQKATAALKEFAMSASSQVLTPLLAPAYTHKCSIIACHCCCTEEDNLGPQCVCFVPTE